MGDSDDKDIVVEAFVGAYCASQVRATTTNRSSILKRNQATRGLMQKMGEEAAKIAGTPVHIEPKEQTRLLDACLKQGGVVCGGVPGGV